MPDKRFTFTGEGRIEDDEEEEKGTPGRPNAWWAEHKGDVEDAAGRAATFDGAVRGVSQGPHGGQQTVKPEDTTGSLTYCWCGLPFDHDWPGKDQGRKHPREEATVTQAGATSEQRIERRQLRAYNDDLVDVIVEAVNGYHARYRMQKNGIVLFPPDGTTGITLNARASARQVKSARLWFLRHCVGVGEDGEPTNPLVKDATVLAEDHEIRSAKLGEDLRATAQAELDEMREAAPETSVTDVAPQGEEPWVVYVGSDGAPSEYMETNGTIIRCKVCKGTDDAYETDNARGLGGHIRIKHRDVTNMYDADARAKALESRRLNRLTAQVREAVENLGKAIGYEPPAPPVDTSQIEALKAENAALLKRAEEAEARIALMREAMGA
jgi:hypothetical protein